MKSRFNFAILSLAMLLLTGGVNSAQALTTTICGATTTVPPEQSCDTGTHTCAGTGDYNSCLSSYCYEGTCGNWGLVPRTSFVNPITPPWCNNFSDVITDSTNQRRYACYNVNTHATTQKPLPLIVYLPGTMKDANSLYVDTNLDEWMDKVSLYSNDSTRVGYHLLSIQARQLCIPNVPTELGGLLPPAQTFRWEVSYRDPRWNVDAQIIDLFKCALVNEKGTPDS